MKASKVPEIFGVTRLVPSLQHVPVNGEMCSARRLLCPAGVQAGLPAFPFLAAPPACHASVPLTREPSALPWSQHPRKAAPAVEILALCF